MPPPDRDRWNHGRPPPAARYPSRPPRGRAAAAEASGQDWLGPLLDELLILGPAERAARLAQMRSADPDLAAELAALIDPARGSAATQFLAGQAADTGPALAGRRVGAYILQTLLGRDSAGSVWRARHAQGLHGGAVAIKLLHPALPGDAGSARFRREGALFARLDHPHIARLFEAGIGENGQAYLAFERVEGECLDRHCDTRQLNVERRLALFADLLSAVAHAHRHLLLHGDIRPGNIRVSAGGVVKLLDFGLARLLAAPPEGAGPAAPLQGFSRPQAPEFVAPEQWRAEALTTATDVYALGVLLYQLLTGRHPTAPEGAGPAEAMRATLESAPLPLAAGRPPEAVARCRATSPARLQRRLRGDLEAIVARALRKAPGERYATVAAFAEDLRRHLAHEPIAAGADSPIHRVARFVRGHRAAVAAGVLAGCAIAAGVAGTTSQARQARDEAIAAHQEARRAGAQAEQAQQRRDHALRALSRAEAAEEFLRHMLGLSSGGAGPEADLLARTEQAINREFADDAAFRARLQLSIARLYGENLDIARAEPLLQRARAAAADGSDAALAAQIDCTAVQLAGTGSARRIADALDRLAAIADADRAALADCLNARAIQHRARGDARAALADAEAALAQLGPPGPGQRATAAAVRTTLGAAYTILGEPGRAIAAHEQAIDTLEQLGRGDATATLTERDTLGVLLTQAGQWRRAAAVFGEALALAAPGDNAARHLLGGHYAVALIPLGRAAQALPLAERALAFAERRGDRGAMVPAALAAAAARCAADTPAGCSAAIAEARRLLAATLPAGHAGFAELLRMQAETALRRGDPAQAQTLLRQASAILEALPQPQPAAARVLTLLARSELRQSDLAAAQGHAAGALAAARAASNDLPYSGGVGEALLAQALVQRSAGDDAAAAATLSEALAQLQQAGGAAAPATAEARALLAGS